MTTFLRKHAGLVIATTAGIALGTTATVILYRLTNNIRRELAILLSRVESLRQEVAQLKASLENRPRHHGPGASSSRLDHVDSSWRSYQSIHASSGDEDEDEFEEAYDGQDGYGTRSSITSDDYQSLSSNGGPVTPLDKLLPQIDRLLDGSGDELQQAYDILSNCQHGLDDLEAGLNLLSSQYSDDVEFVLRFAKATSKIAQSKPDEERKPMTFAAHELAAQALQMTEDNAQVHKWFAITLGCLGDFLPLKDKIQNGFKFREHIQKAMDLNPDDYSSYHLCGRFCYSVYMLSWVERSAAAAIAGNPPSSTPDEALEYFLKAEEKNPKEWKENKLFIAKCYIQKGEYYEVYKWLEKANQVPNVSPDDHQAQDEVDSLLYSYSGYKT